METVLHIIEFIFMLFALVMIGIYLVCRDFGYFLSAVICLASAVLSFQFASIWPLIIGAILTLMLWVVGTGLFKKGEE